MRIEAPAPRQRVTRSLLIAPQWIGDAVMSQPLLARLAARGERITVAALPWVAPVYRAMTAVEQWSNCRSPMAASISARAGVSPSAGADVSTPPMCCRIRQVGAAAVVRTVPRRIGYHGEAR